MRLWHTQGQKIKIKIMAHTPNAFENEIFEHFRTKEKRLKEAKKLLKNNGHIVIEAKNKIEGQYIWSQ